MLHVLGMGRYHPSVSIDNKFLEDLDLSGCNQVTAFTMYSKRIYVTNSTYFYRSIPICLHIILHILITVLE